MLLWLETHLATILISIALIVLVAFIIRGMIQDKRKGKSSCGHSCGSCPMSGRCHELSKKNRA